MTVPPLRASGLALVAGLLAALLSACGAGSSSSAPVAPPLHCPTRNTAPMTVVIGARANSAVPKLPDFLGNLLNQVADAEQQVTLVRLDGNPDPFFQDTFQTQAANGPARDDDLNRFLGSIHDAFSGADARAQVPEVNDLAALSVASRTTAAGGTVVLLDSGLQTTAPLDFRKDDLLLAEPTDVVGFLQDKHLVPDLADRTLLLVGIGDTAAPQAPLDDRLRGNLTATWRAVGQAGKACVDVVPIGARQVAVGGVPPVGEVPLPPPPQPPKRCGDTVLDEQNNVGFEPNTTTFRNPDAARQAVAAVVEQARDGGQRIELIGTTARDGTRDYQLGLSKRRAEAVREIMQDLGIASDRISTDGVGSYSREFYSDDGGPDALDPGKAVRNRRVVVRLICPT